MYSGDCIMCEDRAVLNKQFGSFKFHKYRKKGKYVQV